MGSIGSLIPKSNGFLTDAREKLGKLGDPFSFLSPKATDIFERRSATRISRTHQSIAVKNIGGGTTPRFNENENLYGFSLIEFKKNLLNVAGWANVRAENLLGFDLTDSLTGGDEIANVSSYFFNVNPRSIALSEPFATQVVPTQNSGVYVESQGVVLRSLSISGTTGYRPGIAGIRTTDPTIPHVVGEPTGMLNFIKLRNLFRNYSDLKKDPNQAYKIYMIWYNGKEQETWFCEPTSFNMTRDSGSPFTFKYEISLTLIQKVHFSSIVNTIQPRFDSPHFYLASLRASMALFERIPFIKSIRDSLGLKDGVLNTWVNEVSTLRGFMEDASSGLVTWAAGAGAAAVGMLFLPIVGSITSAQKLIGTGKEISDRFSEMFGHSADDDITGFFSDNLFTLESIWRNAVRDGQEALSVIANNASPVSNLLAQNNNQNGSSVATQATATRNEVIPGSAGGGGASGSGSSTIYGLEEILAFFGVDLAWKDWVILMNGLKPPYISTAPSKRGAAVKGPGDTLILPSDAIPVPGNLNTRLPYKKTFSNVYEELLGRDIKLSKKLGSGGGLQFNFSISPTGDLDLVDGRDNILQALEIKLNVPRGTLLLHPGFGIVDIIGEKGNLNLSYNIYLSVNDTMLSDARIDSLSDLSIVLSGDEANISFRTDIIGSLPYVPVEFSVKV